MTRDIWRKEGVDETGVSPTWLAWQGLALYAGLGHYLLDFRTIKAAELYFGGYAESGEEAVALACLRAI